MDEAKLFLIESIALCDTFVCIKNDVLCEWSDTFVLGTKNMG